MPLWACRPRGAHRPLSLVVLMLMFKLMLMIMIMIIDDDHDHHQAHRGMLGPRGFCRPHLGLQAQRGPEAPSHLW